MDTDISFEVLLDRCARLTKYAAASRYPDELEVDEPMAKAALEQARQVYEFCLAKLPREEA
jgi:HEPN domain-containing protein